MLVDCRFSDFHSVRQHDLPNTMSIRVFIWLQHRISILLVGGTLDCMKGKEERKPNQTPRTKLLVKLSPFLSAYMFSGIFQKALVKFILSTGC